MQLDYFQLANLAKSSEYRESITPEDLQKVRNDFQALHEVAEEDLDTLYHAVRYLRNICINSSKNQDIILSINLLSDFVNVLKKILQLFDVNKEMLLKSKKVCMEFLGNLVVKNNINIQAVWELCSPSIFFDMMSNMDSQGKDITCMVVFNCLRERVSLFEQEEGFWLMVSIIEHCITYDDAEWGLYVLQLVIKSSNFVSLYKKLIDYPEFRLFLLDMLFEELIKSDMEESIFLYFAENFESKSHCIMLLAGESSQQFHEESLLLLKTLSLLCEATSHVKFPLLRQRKSLMQCAIGLLKGMASVDFTKDKSEISPGAGFKRDLIRLIGNMSYQNEIIQNEVRESGGIPLILNACNIDEKNPFIMQWSIFATRNLCEGNIYNQKIIKEFEHQGLASNDILTDSHVRVKIVDGKVKLIPLED